VHFLTRTFENFTLREDFTNRSHITIYYVVVDLPLDAYSIQESELMDLKYTTMPAFIDAARSGSAAPVASKRGVDKLQRPVAGPAFPRLYARSGHFVLAGWAQRSSCPRFAVLEMLQQIATAITTGTPFPEFSQFLVLHKGQLFFDSQNEPHN